MSSSSDSRVLKGERACECIISIMVKISSYMQEVISYWGMPAHAIQHVHIHLHTCNTYIYILTCRILYRTLTGRYEDKGYVCECLQGFTPPSAPLS